MASFQQLADGHHVDDAGSLIACAQVALRGPTERLPITALHKASSKRHATAGCKTIRIWSPGGLAGKCESARRWRAGR